MTSISRARASLAATALMLVAMAVPGCMEPAAMTCPSGIYCPAGAKCAARQAVCIFDDCGDGLLQASEACDDGNTEDGDGCSANCKSNETCGNGITDAAVGEVCDDGNTVSGDHCSADCKSAEECGNGKVDIGEYCDGGPSGTADVAKETPVCNWNCTWSSCGDGIVNASDNEQCDDPNGNSNEGDCLPSCKLNLCGDGFLNNSNSAKDTEECDEGRSNTDTADCAYGLLAQCELCSTSCKRFYGTPHFCGDGTPDADSGEVCDDGPLNGATSCDTYGEHCHPCASDCKGRRDVRGPYCGDGITTNGHEVCDDGNTDTEVACPYGTRACTACRSDCMTVLNLTGPYCGDWRTDTDNGEQCDNYFSFACGTCNSSCRDVITNDATGSVTVQSMTVDGALFTIDDGIHNPVTFELDTTGGCAAGNRCVDVAASTSTNEIATVISVAIMSAWLSSILSIEASVVAGSSVVNLVNRKAGFSGNNSITVSSEELLSHTGMQGGVGCPNRGSCSRNDDCVSGSCNSYGRCF